MLHPALQALLDEAAGRPAIQTVPVEAARAGLLARYGGLPRLPVGEVEDRTIGGSLRLRLYRPGPGAGHPVIVFFHGGGFVIGSIETHDALCRRLCRDVPAVVVSVDYALAPERPFPAGLEDCLAAIRWCAENAASFGGDPRRLALVGDSAGGNLAAVSALRLRDTGGPPIAAQLLAYPVTDAPDPARRSYAERGDGFGLTAAAMRWFFAHYLGDAADAGRPDIAPLRAERLDGLPPTYLVTAEFDPLRDEGVDFARRLAAAGVDVTHIHCDDANHGFLNWAGTNEPSLRELDAACRWLAARLA